MRAHTCMSTSCQEGSSYSERLCSRDTGFVAAFITARMSCSGHKIEGIVVPRTKGSQGLTAAVLPTSALFHALGAESFRKIDTALLRMLSASTQKAVWTPHMVSAEGLCTVQLVEL